MGDKGDFQVPPQLNQLLSMQMQQMGAELPMQQNLNRLRSDYMGVGYDPGIASLSMTPGFFGKLGGAAQNILNENAQPVSIRDMPEFEPFFKSTYAPGGPQEIAIRQGYDKAFENVMGTLPKGGVMEEMLSEGIMSRDVALAQLPAMQEQQNIAQEQQIANMLLTGTPLTQNWNQAVGTTLPVTGQLGEMQYKSAMLKAAQKGGLFQGLGQLFGAGLGASMGMMGGGGMTGAQMDWISKSGM